MHSTSSAMPKITHGMATITSLPVICAAQLPFLLSGYQCTG